MVEILIVGITMGLTVLVSTFYRGQRRVHLLRITCLALFLATVCRGVEPVMGGPGVDLVKRLSILTAQVSIVLLILTFRATSQRMRRNIYIIAGLVAIGETALMWFLPVHPDGDVFQRSEVVQAAAEGKAWSLIAYHCLYLGAFAAAVTIVAVGCWRTMTEKNQPFSARISVGCIFAGALGSALFIGSSIMDMFGRPVFGGSGTRTYILIIVVGLFFLGLATGVIRRVSISLQKTLAVQLARELVIPLWKTTTTLQPGVKLPPEEQHNFNQLMSLSRITIETHDALRLIREDTDPALHAVHQKHPEDPHLSAGLVRHLCGEKAVPPLGWVTVALSRLHTFGIKSDDTLATSIKSLYEIRVAVSEQNR